MRTATELAASCQSKSEVWLAGDPSPLSRMQGEFFAEVATELRRLDRVEQRYQWLRERLLGADFSWGDPATCVWVFETDAPISADLDESIDTALSSGDRL